MTFKLNIEKVYGGYILTIERPDGVERRVIGIGAPILSNQGILNIMNKAVGCTILDKICFTTENKHVVMNIECYGDVAGDSETADAPCQKPQWRPTEEQMKELYTMVCECRPADTQLLSDIYWGLKSQIDGL